MNNNPKYTIATLGSHSSLQILKGAKDEGFSTLLVTTENRISFYRRFGFIDYIIGVTAYLQYFYSPITKTVELLGVDRRYETNVDGLGRIPLSGQEGLDIQPSYVVVANSPLVIRESLLPEVYVMGERIIKASQ